MFKKMNAENLRKKVSNFLFIIRSVEMIQEQQQPREVQVFSAFFALILENICGVNAL